MGKECYLTSVSTEQTHQTLIVKERRNYVEPMEELEEVILIEGDEKKITKIRTTMSKKIQDSIVEFLREMWMSSHGVIKTCLTLALK